MSISGRVAKLAVGLLLGCIALAGGCTKTIVITQYPEFYTPDLKTIAIVPFRNNTPDRTAGENISEQFARALAGNGTYAVYNRSDLKTLLNEKDLQLALGNDQAASAKMFERTGKVQAILTGAVNTYIGTSRNEPKRDPQYAYDRNGNQYVSGYRDWVQTHNEATVVVTAALLRVSDGSGSTIHATAAPVTGRASSDSTSYSPPEMDMHACLAAACNQAVSRLVEEFGVVNKKISIDPAKAFRTASDYYDGKYNVTDRFSASDEKMLVVLSLPPSCDRNRFRITVVREESRNDLAEIKLIWDRKWGGAKDFVLSPRDIAAKGGGAGTYLVKFYSGPEPVIINKIQIK